MIPAANITAWRQQAPWPEDNQVEQDLILGLEERGTQFSGQMAHAAFDAVPTSGVGRIRVKVEINIAEIDSRFPRIAIPTSVDSPWWQGGAEIVTFSLEELTGTKLRALYQRSKGRDLFDLWLVLTRLDPDDEKIASAFHHYMGPAAFTFPELSLNLSAKLADRDFSADLTQLVANAPQAYDSGEAADLVMERLGRYLRNAPEQAAIANGAWRR